MRILWLGLLFILSVSSSWGSVCSGVFEDPIPGLRLIAPDGNLSPAIILPDHNAIGVESRNGDISLIAKDDSKLARKHLAEEGPIQMQIAKVYKNGKTVKFQDMLVTLSESSVFFWYLNEGNVFLRLQINDPSFVPDWVLFTPEAESVVVYAGDHRALHFPIERNSRLISPMGEAVGATRADSSIVSQSYGEYIEVTPLPFKVRGKKVQDFRTEWTLQNSDPLARYNEINLSYEGGIEDYQVSSLKIQVRNSRSRSPYEIDFGDLVSTLEHRSVLQAKKALSLEIEGENFVGRLQIGDPQILKEMGLEHYSLFVFRFSWPIDDGKNQTASPVPQMPAFAH